MSSGWVRVAVPAMLQDLVVWSVRVGDVTGGPGDLIPAPPGDHPVVIEVELALPTLRIAGRLEVTANVSGGRVTSLSLPFYGLADARAAVVQSV